MLHFVDQFHVFSIVRGVDQAPVQYSTCGRIRVLYNISRSQTDCLFDKSEHSVGLLIRLGHWFETFMSLDSNILLSFPMTTSSSFLLLRVYSNFRLLFSKWMVLHLSAWSIINVLVLCSSSCQIPWYHQHVSAANLIPLSISLMKIMNSFSRRTESRGTPC